MIGIKACGAYVPFFRLKLEDIAKALGGRPGRGEKAVANFDEDSITMGVAAALDCLHGMNHLDIDALYFASTTLPFQEKQCAPIIATALDLRREIMTADFGTSLRVGTIALRAAFDAVKAGSAKNVLFIAADCRPGAPGSDFEQVFGDGAVAFIIGDSDAPLATLDNVYSHVDEFIDLWRAQGDDFVKSWEDRYIYEEGYLRNIAEGVAKFMEHQKVTAKDVSKVILSGADQRRHQQAAAKLKLDYKTQIQDPMFDRLGNTGSAHALMMLVAALEEAKEGDRFLVANYGDGCDVLLFSVGKPIGNVDGRRGIKEHLIPKNYIPSYEKYLSFRKLLTQEAERRRPPQASSPPVLWRDHKWIYGFNAGKCNQCGRLFFPPQRVCLYCQSKDDFEYVRLTGRKGTLFTFNRDFLARSDDSPEMFARVHIEGEDGNVGVYCRMTDRVPDAVKIGMPMEMTFRKFHEGAGYPNYFWKCMPSREVKV